jgi:signal transduction histidine kinase
MEQVILNLVANARDAMPDGGEIVVETSSAERDDLGGCVLVSVKDTGSGIDADLLPHIFEPFFTTKPRKEGSGLGLATVYGFVKQSGGVIAVDSNPGRGATFWIYLPRAEAMSQNEQSVRAAARGGTIPDDQDSAKSRFRGMLVGCAG